MINLKISRIRPLFQNFRENLISRISAVPIFCGIKFRGNSQIWPKNAKSAKFNPNKVIGFTQNIPKRNLNIWFFKNHYLFTGSMWKCNTPFLSVYLCLWINSSIVHFKFVKTYLERMSCFSWIATYRESEIFS